MHSQIGASTHTQIYMYMLKYIIHTHAYTDIWPHTELIKVGTILCVMGFKLKLVDFITLKFYFKCVTLQL